LDCLLYLYLVASRPKASRTPLGVLDDTNVFHLGRFTTFEHELRHAVPPLRFKHVIAVIEEENLNFTRVIGINDTRTDLNPVFDRETGARRDATIRAYRYNNCDARVDKRAGAR